MDGLDCMMVAALDLGTLYSGYAFSLKSTFETDPLKIHWCEIWYGRRCSVLSHKSPTCLLLDKNKELKTFGYGAENEYADICEVGDQDDYYFFSGFNTKKNIKRDTMLIEEAGKSLLASHVFKMFIKAIVNHLMKDLDKNQLLLQQEDIRWVIPVSADLVDTGKQFLRSCAEEAGIPSDQLVFVTESEAALMYCLHLPSQDHYKKLKDGNEFMVVQLEGCGADITVLKKDNNQVMEKYRTPCNDCGSTSVDNILFDFFVKIFGLQLMTSFKKEKRDEYLDIQRSFEYIQSSYQRIHGEHINMKIPRYSLDRFCQKYLGDNIKNIIFTSMFGNDIRLTLDKIQINSDLFHNIFKPTIGKIVYLMENVFANYDNAPEVTDIVMVGDYSECILVQESVRQMFSKKNIMIPKDPGLAVMKGAVLCGHQPCQYIQVPSSEMKGAQTSVTKCIFCDNPGIYYCTECKSAFCQQCRTKHDKLPSAKTHTVTDLKKIDRSAFSTNAICVSHKSEFVYFCTRCHVLICGKCVTTEHKGHDITDIKTVANDCRRSAEENISDLKIAVTKLSKTVGHMKEIEKPTIQRTSDSAMAEIDEADQKITKVVFFTKRNKLDEVQNQHAIEIEEFRYDLKNKERIYDHRNKIYESLERLMHESNDITFITAYEKLKRDIHEISDYFGERGLEKEYMFNEKVFVQEVVNAIVFDFEMSLEGRKDGSVVAVHKGKIKGKEKEKKQK